MTQPPFSRVVADLVSEIADRHPDRSAIIAGDSRITYSELHQTGARLAAGLASLGIGRQSRVGLLCSNRPEWLYTLVGATRLGAAVAAFDTWSRSWDLDHLLANSEVEVLVTLDEFRGRSYVEELCDLLPELASEQPGAWRSSRFPALREVVVLGEDVPVGAHQFDELLREDGRDASGSASAAGEPALIVYTSGSTARPKGVPLLNYAAIENGFNIGERMALNDEDRVWIAVPLFWSYGCANALMATLTHGATAVLQEVFEPGEALTLIEQHACTVAYTLPAMTTQLVGHPSFSQERTASLRTGLTIGLPEDIRIAAEVLGVPGICNIYGSTETYGNSTVTPTEWPLEGRLASQGLPLPGMRIRIVDRATGLDRPVGEAGDILVGGYVTRGYVGNDLLTSQTFAADGSYRTGDIGYLDEAGALHFVARDSEMIKTGGINVSPLEIESFIARHPAVSAVGVVGRPDEHRGQVVVAFVVFEHDTQLSGEELRAYCKRGIASYKVPAEIIACEGLPTTATGKLDRRALLGLAEGVGRGD